MKIFIDIYLHIVCEHNLSFKKKNIIYLRFLMKFPFY